MEDVIEVSPDMDELGDIIFDKGKAIVPYEVGNILDAPGEEVIHTDYLMFSLNQIFAEVRAQKPCSTGDQCSLHGCMSSLR
jgi:hypothetical protein